MHELPASFEELHQRLVEGESSGCLVERLYGVAEKRAKDIAPTAALTPANSPKSSTTDKSAGVTIRSTSCVSFALAIVDVVRIFTIQQYSIYPLLGWHQSSADCATHELIKRQMQIPMQKSRAVSNASQNVATRLQCIGCQPASTIHAISSFERAVQYFVARSKLRGGFQRHFNGTSDLHLKKCHRAEFSLSSMSHERVFQLWPSWHCRY